MYYLFLLTVAYAGNAERASTLNRVATLAKRTVSNFVHSGKSQVDFLTAHEAVVTHCRSDGVRGDNFLTPGMWLTWTKHTPKKSFSHDNVTQEITAPEKSAPGYAEHESSATKVKDILTIPQMKQVVGMEEAAFWEIYQGLHKGTAFRCKALKLIQETLYRHYEKLKAFPGSLAGVDDHYLKRFDPLGQTTLLAVGDNLREMLTEIEVTKLFAGVRNIVQLLREVRFPDWTFGLALKRAPGNTLNDIMRGSKTSKSEDELVKITNERQRLKIAREMLAGLNAIHAQGIVHADLTPSNIQVKLEKNGQVTSVVIIDFGQARRTALKEETTRTVQTVYTYRAPETAEGKEISTAYDMWSLGMILFALFYGADAHDELTKDINAKYFNYLKKDQPEEFKKQWPNLVRTALGKHKVDEAVKGVIRSCLEMDPLQRKTASEALKVFEELLSVKAGGHRGVPKV